MHISWESTRYSYCNPVILVVMSFPQTDEETSNETLTKSILPCCASPTVHMPI